MPPDFSRDVHCLLGLPFDAVNLTVAEQRIRASAADHSRCFLSTPNLNFLVAAQTDAAFRDSVINSDLSVADGVPIVWLAKLLGLPIRQRVAGSDIFQRLMQPNTVPLSVFFFGGMEGVAEAACRKLNAEPAGIVCAGFESPGFGSVEAMSSAATIASINASKADFLVVALGAKKGQAWIEHNRHRLSVPVISHLGAVVNFVAGTVNRAPMLIQRTGLEWLWRIKEEPALWRRYFADGLALVRLLVTRVIPYAWYLRRNRNSADQPSQAGIESREDASVLTISLRGVFTHGNLDSLRDTFSKAVLSEKKLALDMSDLIAVDSAFVGLVSLLYGYQKEQGRDLQISHLSKAAHKTITYCCAEYLIQSQSMPR